MNKVLTSFLFIFSFVSVFAQQNLMIVTSNMQNGLTVCENRVNFSVTIENPSPFDILNPTVTITLPTGVTYVLGSGSNCTESNVSNLSQPIFTIPTVVSLQNPNYTFLISLEASCEVKDFLLSGGNLVNVVSIDYDAQNGPNTLTNQNQTHTSSGYNIEIPNLSLVSISNQAYSGVVGDIFSRCITLVNGGDGSLSVFNVLDEHSSSISINSISSGSQSPVASGDLITLSASDFISNTHPSSNGDGFFDPGESIEICETIEILSCNDASSDLFYWWGCNNDTCQILTDAANVTFPGQVPELNFTATNSYQRNGSLNNVWQGSMNQNCYGNNATGDFEAGLEVTNVGTGTAYEIEIEVFQGWTTNMTANMYSSLNTSSFQVYRNGVLEGTISFDSLRNSQTKPCLPPNPIGQVFFTLDSLNPNDTFLITWNHYTCCYDLCANSERRHLLGWMYRGVYRNSCFDDYTIPLAMGSDVSYFRNEQVLDASPGTMLGTSTGTLSFLTQSYEFVIPRTTSNDLFYYQIILPPCIQFVPGSTVMRDEDGVLIGATFDSIVTHPSASGDTINLYASNYGQVGGVQHTLSFDISLDCSSCTSTGVQEVTFKSFYIPDLNCNCSIQQACLTEEIEIQCPQLCEGANLMDVTAERFNYGLPDNDNNGFPDATGTLDFNQVKTNRLMYGDTLEVVASAYINNPNNVNFSHFYAQSDIADIGSRFAFDFGNLTVYDASSGSYFTCNNVTGTGSIVTSGNTRSFVYDIDLVANAACINVTSLQTGDSVFWTGYFHIDNNIGGNILAGQVENYAFASDVPYSTPVDSSNFYGCNRISRNIVQVGYYWTNYGPNSYLLSNCDTTTITQNYYLSIGPCCSNYAGGNLFPFEYRYWGYPDTLTVTLPDDYTYIDARFNFIRTSGTLNSSTSPWFNINPVLPITNNIYQFVTEPYFGDDQVNDSIFYGDDGWHGTLQVRVAANCNVADSSATIRYNWEFGQNDQMQSSNTPPISNNYNNDEIAYQAPNLNLQSNLVSVNSNTGHETWTLTLTNTSFISFGSSGWIGAPSTVGVTADSIYDAGAGTMLFPSTNGIFSLGDIPPNSQSTYTLYTSMTNCNPDSIIVYYGWGCSGVPNDVASYECDAKSIKLSITPLFPEMGNTIISTVGDTIDLCDNVIYEVEVRNFQLGNAYELFTRISLPQGMTLVAGSSQFSYGGPFTSIADPTLITGSLYEYDIDGLNIPGLAQGLVGISDPNSNSFLIRFEVSTGCNYESGSRVLVQSFSESFCGEPRISIPELSNQLFISDALPPYASDIILDIDFLTPCAGGSFVDVIVINNGPQPTSVNDSITVDLYPGMTYISGSFIPSTNGPLASSFSDSIYNNHQYVSWHMPAGVAVGDSVIFQINIDADPEALECGIARIGAFATTSGSSLCNASACNVSVITGDTARNIFVYKSYLDLLTSSATSVPNAPSGETVSLNFDIGNYGETVIAGTPTVIQFYNDNDNNGGLSAGDTHLINDTIYDQINYNDTITYSNTFNFNSPNTCQIIAVIDTALNPCMCTPQQISIPIVLQSPMDTTWVCSLDQAVIGSDSISGYTYSWQNPTNLNSVNLANPTYTAPVASYPVIDSIYYVRDITKIGCSSVDTALIIVYPNTVLVPAPDDTLCVSDVLTLTGSLPASYETGTWSLDASFANPGAVTFSLPNENVTTVSGYTTGTYQFLWTVTNGICNPVSDTITIVFLPQLIANAGIDQDLCNTYTTTLDGNAPTGVAFGAWSEDPTATNPSVVTLADNTLFNTTISGLQEGTYTLLWTVSNGKCVDAVDTVLINVYDQPTSNAGADQDLCNTYTTTLDGNAPVGTATGMWSEDPAATNPSVVTFTDNTLFNTTISGLQEGTYTLLWTVSNGNCTPAVDTVLINVYDQPTSNAGADQDLCNTYTTTLDGNAPVGTATGMWSEDPTATNPSVVTFTDNTLFNTTISGLQEGTYTLLWTLSNGNCTPAVDTVLINVYDQPTSNAGADQDLCNTYTTTLDGNAPVGTATGMWSEDPAATNPSVVTFTDNTLFNTTISGLQEGTYTLLWTVSNGNCTPAVDTVLINVYDQPTSNAGVDQDLCNTYTTTLDGNAPVGTATGMWSEDPTATNPSVVTFTDNTLFNTTISGLQEGTYTLLWTVSNGNCTPAVDTVLINVYDQPTSNAGADQDLCNTYTTTLDGNAPVGTATGMWSEDPTATNPSVVTFTDNTLFNTTISGLQEGTYTLLWTVSNGNCTLAVDTVLINVYDQPTSNAGADQDLCNTYTTTLDGNAPVGTATGMWSEDVAAANPSVVTFTDNTLFNTTISGLQEGTYTLLWTVSNGNCTPAVDTVLINVYDQPTSNAGADQDLCNTYTTTLDGNAPVGTATGMWSEDPAATNPSVVTFTDNTLFNTTISGLQEGTYTLLWTVSNGNCTPAVDTVLINVYDQPTSNAGADQDLCNTYTTTLDGNAPVGTATGMWSEDPTATNPSVVTFTDNTLFNTTISGLQEGTYTLLWTVSNGNCTPAVDMVLINVYDQPVATLGSDLSICDSLSVMLQGNGMVGTATGLWSLDPLFPNASAATFSNPTSDATSIDNLTIGNYQVIWTVSNGSCPSDSDTLNIENKPLPVAIIASPAEVCSNLCFNVQSLSTAPSGFNLNSTRWIIDGNIYINPSETVCITTPDIYDIDLVVSATNGCTSDTTTASITVNPSPIAGFEFVPNDSIYINEFIGIEFTGTSDIIAIEYDLNNGDQSNEYSFDYLYKDTGVYEVTQYVENQFNCRDTLIKELVVKEDLFLYVPSAFTPNGDGINDVFIPVISRTDIVEIEFWLFDRWGNLIFKDSDINISWDGTHHGMAAPQDVYVWKVQYRLERGTEVKTLRGHVSLLR